MIKNLTRWFSTRATPRRAPIPNACTPQVRNEAGGYGWAVDTWTRLDRFLVLGAEGGTFYATERKLTVENATAVLTALEEDGLRVVRRVVEVSTAGRAPKSGPAVLALAMALKLGSSEVRAAAREAVPAVCRTGTHLFELAEAVQALGGWGRGTRRAFADWYLRDEIAKVAWQAVKYQAREGWSHRDLLRKSHPVPRSAEQDALFRWIVRGELPAEVPGALRLVEAFEEAKRATSAREIVQLVERHALPREAIPSRFLGDPAVWAALLAGMPMTATLRSLAKMTAVGLLTPHGEATRLVVDRLADEERLRKARIHPLAALVALQTYRSGRGVRGSLAWDPVQRIVDALDGAFYTTFANVEPTGRRWMLAVDVSGSMGWGTIAGLPGITPRVGATAMALVTAAREAEHTLLGFSHRLVRLPVSPRMRLDQAVDAVSRVPMGGTDCALPMLHATEARIPVDVFVVYTDSETWYGAVHPAQALRRYREATGIAAKLVVVGMTSNGFTIADPDDAGMLDVVGFDPATPAVIADLATT